MTVSASGTQNGVLSAGAAAAGTGAPTAPATPSLQSLQPATPTATTISASQGTAGTVGAAPTATAGTSAVAGINKGMINPNDPTNAAAQLNAITASGSPYMDLARQQGMLSAASRGLQNSSLGAGASEAAAVQAAAPLAEQNAQGATAANLQNSQLQTQASEFNVGESVANQQLQAQLATQTSQFNAGQIQAADATNAAAQNAIKQQVAGIQAQLSSQFLSGVQSQQLADIQGRFSQLIAQNQSAASLTQQYLGSMGNIFNNKDIDAGRAASEATALLSMLHTSLSVIDQINGGTANVPGPTTPTRPVIPRPGVPTVPTTGNPLFRG